MLAIAQRPPAAEIVEAVGTHRQHFKQHDRFVEMIEVVGGETGRGIDIGVGEPARVAGPVVGLQRLGAILIFHRKPIAPNWLDASVILQG